MRLQSDRDNSGQDSHCARTNNPFDSTTTSKAA
jgi:hypothetical protein